MCQRVSGKGHKGKSMVEREFHLISSRSISHVPQTVERPDERGKGRVTVLINSHLHSIK